MPLRPLVIAFAMTLVVAACGRSDNSATAPTSAVRGATAATTNGRRLQDGGFGSLTHLCGPGNAKPVNGRTGIDGTTIKVGVFSDYAFAGIPGINKEFVDNANSIVRWCNGLGGVRGYKLEPVIHSSALTEYAAKMLDACQSDFFLVGGGGVLDDTGEKSRLGCGLPNLSAFSLTPTAATADIALTTLPNPNDQVGVAEQRYAERRWPDAIKKVAVTTIATPQTTSIRDRYLEYYRDAGWQPILSYDFAPLGESNWTPFVQAMKDKGVEIVNAVTIEPQMLTGLLQAAATIDYRPKAWIVSTNNYDPTLIRTAGANAVNVYTRSAFWPVELAGRNPATRDYLTLLGHHKHSVLGEQAFSSWMLFIQSVGTCVDAGTLTRDCVYTEAAKHTDWTGGGLHGPLDVTHHNAPRCAIIMQATPKGWVVAPGQKLDRAGYNCDAANVAELKGNYGTGAKCPSGAADPLPSTCG